MWDRCTMGQPRDEQWSMDNELLLQKKGTILDARVAPPGGRLQLVLMRHPPSYLSKLAGGVLAAWRGGGMGQKIWRRWRHGTRTSIFQNSGGVGGEGGGGLGGVAYKDRARPPPRG